MASGLYELIGCATRQDGRPRAHKQGDTVSLAIISCSGAGLQHIYDTKCFAPQGTSKKAAHGVETRFQYWGRFAITEFKFMAIIPCAAAETAIRIALLPIVLIIGGALGYYISESDATWTDVLVGVFVVALVIGLGGIIFSLAAMPEALCALIDNWHYNGQNGFSFVGCCGYLPRS